MTTRNDAVAFLQTHVTKVPLLVAIDGHSAAGKSTFARFIQSQFANVVIFHADDFYRAMDERERMTLDAKDGYITYYDWQRLEQHVLLPLSHRRSAQYQRYDWVTNQLGAWVEVHPEGMIIVEGVYTLRPELRRYYDVKFVVQTNRATRMRRQGERADPWEWVKRWDAAEVYYMQWHNPKLYADMVVH